MTDDNTGILIGGTKLDVTKEYAKDVAAGSAVGALSGLVFVLLQGAILAEVLRWELPSAQAEV